MKFRNVTKAQLNNALGLTSLLYYNNNLIWNRGPDAKGNSFVATLRVRDSHAVGARKTWTGRHGVGASWHAHRDFFRALYRVAPNAIIDTGLYGSVRYTSAAQFEIAHVDTYFANVGSQMNPVALGSLSILNTLST